MENLEGLIKKAENIENDQQEQVKQDAPGYQSADDLNQQVKERALWILGGFQALTSKVAPEASNLVLTDPAMDDGVEKLTAVLKKYPGAELPPWLKNMMQYREEFLCGMWFAGTFYGVYKVNQQVQAEKAAADPDADPGADPGAGSGDSSHPGQTSDKNKNNKEGNINGK